MKIAFYTVGGQVLGPIEDRLRSKGIEVLTNSCDDTCDFIYLSTVTVTPQIWDAVHKYPDIPLVVYNWDQYAWHHTQKGYYWEAFNILQQKSVEIWTPSEAVNLRVEEFIGPTSKFYIIKSFARLFDYPKDKVKNGGYVAHVIRNYTLDPQWGWAQQACSELGIDLHMNDDHHRSEEEFQKWLAEANLLLCPYYEASTGGLSLLEGFNIGKPVLVCDSPYLGAKDYFGDNAFYFKNGDYEDFKLKLNNLFNSPPKLNLETCQQVASQYQLDNMVDHMISRFKFLSNK